MPSSPTRTEPVALLEREHVLGAIDTALGAAVAPGRGSVALVCGPAGIGKSSVLEAALPLAGAHGLTVLRARGAESESGFPFGGALQLLERAVAGAAGHRPVAGATGQDDAAAALLSGAAELARPVLEGRFLAGEGGPVASAVHGLFWLTVNLAARAPLALVVDDLHALDDPTLTYLLYLQRRIEELPVVLLGATRLTERHGRPALAELVLAPEVMALSLEPLGEESVARIVRRELDPAAEDSFCRACARVSGGNPFYLAEALRELSRERTPTNREGARRLEQIEPRAVSRAVLLRLARAPEGAVALAQAAAVLGPGVELALVAGLAGLPAAAALDGAEALIAAAILQRADPIEFTHALIAAAIASDLSASRRGALHLRAAELLRERHVPPERIVGHLMAAPPSARAEHVEILATAAAHALEAGVPALAAGYLERALAEPPATAERRAELLLELARAEIATDPRAASDHLQQARELGVGGHRAGELALALGRALYVSGRHGPAARVFLAGAEGLREHDPLARELQAWFISASVFVAELRPRATELARRLAATPPAHPTPAERAVIAQVAAQQVIAGVPLWRVRPLAELAWGEGRLLADETCDGYSWMHVTAVHLWGGDYARAREVAEQVLDDARRRGSVMAFATASYIRASAWLWEGSLLECLADVERTLDVHRRYGWTMFLGAAHYVAIEAHLERGELDAAEALAALAADQRFAGSAEGAMLRFARARLWLARERPREALGELEALAAEAARSHVDAPRLLPVWEPLASALHRLGEPQRARAVLAEGERRASEAQLADVLARVLVARSRLEDGLQALETLQAAVDSARASQSRLELARAQVELGARLRRAGRRSDSREALREGLEVANRCGASVLEARAREELAVLGSRPRRAQRSGWEALTASELRVVRLAADGLTNREIAESLFVTPKTVEYHLRNAFMKLDVSSRAQLTGALAGAS
jgi:DNA-binding CsgD family transcriptional regulator